MNQAQALYSLQDIDLSINKAQARIAEIKHLLEDDEAVQIAQQQLLDAQASLAPWRTKMQDLELEIKSLSAKSAGVEQRLYSGSVNNPKELQDMQEEIASLARRKTKLEDDLLEAMMAVEQNQAQVASATQELERIKAEFAAQHNELVTEHKDLEASLADLQAQRSEALTSISPDSLQAYEKLLQPKHGYVVARLTNGSCEACGVSQTTQTIQQVRQGRSLVNCNNCGRILVII